MRIHENKDGYFINVTLKKDIPWIEYLEDAKYLAKVKNWYIPKTPFNRKVLQKKGLIRSIHKVKNKKIPRELKEKLPDRLYDVQMKSLEFAYNRKGSCLLALDMGLGKTATSLCYTLLEDIQTTLIICQASLKTQWASEISQWLGESDIEIIYGQQSHRVSPRKFIIINYEILSYWWESLQKLNLDLIIIDEVQFFQNYKAQRTKALEKLAFKSDRVLALSGTPITKSPVQFYPILHILAPHEFPTFWKFTKKFCDPHKDYHGRTTYGISNLEEFREILDNIMVRFTKKDSLDIPEKLIIPLLLDFSPEILLDYQEAEKKAVEEIFGEGTAENKKSFTYLQYLAYTGKREALFSWISDMIEDRPLVVFCEHRKIVEDIHEYFKKDAVKYYGGMTQKQKDKSKDAFLKGKKKLFVGNSTSAGTGLDGLQKVCNTAVIVELPYTATKFDQCTDRLWRSGQDSDVNIYVAMAKGSIEQRIMHILDRSRAIVEQVVDGKSKEEIHFLKELVKNYLTFKDI